jgi:hypothetical protein
MPEAVRCDICGKLYSSRHVKSHKRLAHAEERSVSSAVAQDRMKTILKIYKTLSPENKKLALAQLTACEKEPS